MTINVLVVDDSLFFRRRVTDFLQQSPQIKVIGQANNGQEAIQQVKLLRPDVVTMDVEMPVMDGISAVKHIMQHQPLPVLMFSSLTHEGAQATLDALDAGAADFLPKNFEEIANSHSAAISALQQKVIALARSKATRNTVSRARLTNSTDSLRPEIVRPSASAWSSSKGVNGYKLLAVGASTGGPVALQKLLSALPADFPYPILLVQHMPGAFTTAYAERLNGLCQISVKEAEDGDMLQPGCAYLAPGGQQMILEGTAQRARVKITELANHQERITYKPSVDITFASICRLFQGNVLATILTGMGADGREGCKLLKNQGATIWAQDADSCVVYGMPQAVTKAGIVSENIDIDIMGRRILVEMMPN